jgi:FkbM family methyltransferase
MNNISPEEVSLSWNFNSNENKLSFVFNKTFEDVTLVLKERTSNLTCYYWKNATFTSGVNYFVIPTEDKRLVETDFTGFVLTIYENRIKVFNTEIKVIDRPVDIVRYSNGGTQTISDKELGIKSFYSDDGSDLNISDSFYVQYLDFYNNSFLNKIVKEDDVIIDVGASCGTFAHYCLNRKAKKVVCLEPSPSFYILDKTFDSCVDKYNCALGTNNGYRQFYFTDKTTLNSFKIDDQKKYDTANMVGIARPVTVECITLDSVIKRSNLDKINLLKLDIEGFEYDIFKSLSIETLANIDQVLIEFHHNKNHKTQIIVDKLVQAGYDLKYLNLNFESWYTLCDLKGVIYGKKKQ